MYTITSFDHKIMVTIIAGSRHITNYNLLCAVIEESGFDITQIICGCAEGVDRLGLIYAITHQIPHRMFPADWLNISHQDAVVRYRKTPNFDCIKYDAKAGHRRNYRMAIVADVLIALWDGESKGTKDMISLAKQRGLAYYVLNLKTMKIDRNLTIFGV